MQFDYRFEKFIIFNSILPKNLIVSAFFSCRNDQVCLRNQLPVNVTDHWREGVEEEGGDFVEAVEHQRVPPDDDGETDRT